MYGKKKKKKLWIMVFLGVVIAFFLLYYSLSSHRKLGYIESFLKDIAISVNRVVMWPFTALNVEKEEKAEDSYLIQKNLNVHLEEEIEELRKMLDLDQTLTGYEPVHATVLSRNRSYWYQTLTLDKGKKAGIKENMVVITKDGLVGKIEKVTNFSSTVKLITANDINNKVSVSIATEQSEGSAILSGYDQEENLVLVTGVDSHLQVKKGDVITTSGLGGMFPRGIYIGRVEKIEEDKYEISKTLGIKTQQEFNKIHYVTVLKERSKE